MWLLWSGKLLVWWRLLLIEVHHVVQIAHLLSALGVAFLAAHGLLILVLHELELAHWLIWILFLLCSLHSSKLVILRREATTSKLTWKALRMIHSTHTGYLLIVAAITVRWMILGLKWQLHSAMVSRRLSEVASVIICSVLISIRARLKLIQLALAKVLVEPLQLGNLHLLQRLHVLLLLHGLWLKWLLDCRHGRLLLIR